MSNARPVVLKDRPGTPDVGRTMLPRRLSLLLFAAALALLALPALASAATPKYPTVQKVTPLKLRIGDQLTIRGSGFMTGRNRNTVVFKAPKQRAVFARAGLSTSKKLVIMVPTERLSLLKASGGRAVATRFQIGVLARKLSRAYAPLSASPVITPAL